MGKTNKMLSDGNCFILQFCLFIHLSLLPLKSISCTNHCILKFLSLLLMDLCIFSEYRYLWSAHYVASTINKQDKDTLPWGA